jgi:hypothetical protein
MQLLHKGGITWLHSPTLDAIEMLVQQFKKVFNVVIILIRK